MELDEFVGRSETAYDRIDETFLADAAAVLDVPRPADGCMPPLWHWMRFGRWVPPDELRADGGLRGEGFLPPLHHLPRRMAAGGRLVFHRPIRSGETVKRDSRIHALQRKQGRNGPLVLLTIRRTFAVGEETVLEEDQEVVYLPETPVGSPRPAPTAAAPAWPLSVRVRSCRSDPLTLFRYSAMTCNSHRIHYDLDYATRKEGFPGLVVHGPLQATWLASLAESLHPDRRLGAMQFRNVGPAYHTDELEAAAWEEGGTVQLALARRAGGLCITGWATMLAR